MLLPLALELGGACVPDPTPQVPNAAVTAPDPPRMDACPATAPATGAAQGSLVTFASADELQAFRRHHGQVWGGATDGSSGPRVGTIGWRNFGSTGSGGEGISVTNVQEEAVDEGGIVKVARGHLVVLRRGRLFSIKIGDDALEPVDSIEVGMDFEPLVWNDEFLVAGSELLVITYSYMNRATQISRFEIGPDGHLEHHVTDYLRSGSDYASRNHTSRLVRGKTLVFYMPNLDIEQLPELCVPEAWGCGAWNPVVDLSHLYKPLRSVGDIALHTVVTCDLSTPGAPLRCAGTGIFGPAPRHDYVSERAVYLWVMQPSEDPSPPWRPRRPQDRNNATVYRIDLRDRTASAVRGFGTPIDPLSFEEDSRGDLRVLVHANRSGGDGTWAAGIEMPDDLALFRAAGESFVAGKVFVSGPEAYVDLPDPPDPAFRFQNRFLPGFLLYGSGTTSTFGDEGRGWVWAHDLADQQTIRIDLPSTVDQIEPLLEHAVVIGTAERGLAFAAIDLSSRPRLAGTFIPERPTPVDTRSHGFAYAPRAATGGWLGLPIFYPRGRGAREEHEEVLYLDVHDLQFTQMGALESKRGNRIVDGCEGSCFDGGGNARSVILGERVFALLGDEVIEGEVTDGRLRERRRLDILDALRGGSR